MQDDQLLGYLLRALEPEEMLEVERQLQANPRLRARLDQLEAMLEPLSELNEEFTPPPDLVQRTLQAVDTARDNPEWAEPSLLPAVAKTSERSNVGLSEMKVLKADDAWSWWDSGFTVCAVAALLAMLFPALYQTREQARAATCQDQLRQLGGMLIGYAAASPDQRVPNLDASGREAFAGVYSVRLKGAGLLEEDGLVWCPTDPVGMVVPEVPDPATLATADEQSLGRWQLQAGGRYAYNLGVLEGNQYRAPRLRNLSHFALMSDVVRADGMAPHPGVINILYEDGHVERVGMHSVALRADHPFLNRARRREAGLDAFDAVLGPSSTPPFVWVEQR
jgi:prepilin-type processing-associated H-X9-DG protein